MKREKFDRRDFFFFSIYLVRTVTVGGGAGVRQKKVAFPFCLINSPERSFMGVPSALNHLRPGWVLTESMYTIVRNEDKYRRRAKARLEG